jgi:hypothetical protein
MRRAPYSYSRVFACLPLEKSAGCVGFEAPRLGLGDDGGQALALHPRKVSYLWIAATEKLGEGLDAALGVVAPRQGP